jgi:hypothetical protein
MGLLDLPLEILDDIIDRTLPSGIESFALCCTAVHARAASQIRRHNALKRQWKHTSHTGPRRGDTLQILYDILHDPLAAQYIETLNLWDRRELGTGDSTDFRADRESMAGIRKMVLEAECLHKAGIDGESWWNKMTDGEDPGDVCPVYTAIALLSQLPNLIALQLPHEWYVVDPDQLPEDDYKQLVPVLDAMVEYANSAKGGDKPLRRLEAVLPFMPEGYEERAALQCVASFLRLKSIRSLYAVSSLAVDDHYTGVPFQWHFPHVDSSLTRVELPYCCLDADEISVLASHTPQLKVFKYSHQTKWHGCQYDWNPGTFAEAVSKHCGESIVELALTIDELHGEVVNGVSCFFSFPKLEILEVDAAVFRGPPVESGQKLGSEPHLEEGESAWTEEDIPCIGDMLPDGIREVHINIDYPDPDESVTRILLKNVKEHRTTNLGSLAKFTVRQYSGDGARPLTDDAEVILEAFEKGRARKLPRSMMPVWKRVFEEQVSGFSHQRGQS